MSRGLTLSAPQCWPGCWRDDDEQSAQIRHSASDRELELILVEDLTSEQRWPRWTPLTAGLGIGGLTAVHLHTDIALGSLNLYSELIREYDEVDLETARVRRT